jgi:hypothetical protein
MGISGAETVGPTSKTIDAKRPEPRVQENVTNERIKEERRNPPKDIGKAVSNNGDGDSSAIG